MRLQKFLLVCAAVMFTSSAFAQRAEVFGYYSYMQYNNTVSGFQSRAFNGGGGGFQLNINQMLGIKGEFTGYGSTQWTQEVTAPIPTPNGTIIPVGTYKSNANSFQYLFGPVVGVQVKRVRPYGHLLFGQTNTTGYADLNNFNIVGGTASWDGTQHPFTMAFGGGFDVSVSNRVAFRLGQLDWVLTRYTNPFTGTNNQNSYRYQGGIVVKFGGL
jgi:hypothetical protein